jgi:quinohemoprotein ethanol dehydrogenase
VAGDLAIIGNAGAEYDTRGYVTAYDLASGRQVWRFFTIPHDPKLGPQETPELEQAAKTWAPDSRWDIGGGGTAWDAINYDARFDTVIIGVGNGGPYNIMRRSPGAGTICTSPRWSRWTARRAASNGTIRRHRATPGTSPRPSPCSSPIWR